MTSKGWPRVVTYTGGVSINFQSRELVVGLPPTEMGTSMACNIRRKKCFYLRTVTGTRNMKVSVSVHFA
jgi:hypothetical protein